MSLRFNGCCVRSLHHRGVVLDPGLLNSWDKGAASLGCAFVDDDEPDKVFLFYSGATDTHWSRGAIGLAISKEGFHFRKIRDNPLIEGENDSFYAKEAIFPAVVKVRNRFYMVFTCRPSKKDPRSIGIAYADDVKGPWNVIGSLIKPSGGWEGNNIDNGPGIVHLSEGNILVYYSSLSRRITFGEIVAKGLRRLRVPFPYFYFVRRIGILKVKIRGTTRSKIETLRYVNNPLGHLNGPRGSWNESVFCPGYISLGKTECLFPAASIYSSYPPRQFLGVATSSKPFFRRNETKIQKVIDGLAEKRLVMPDVKGEIAIDSPSPIILPMNENKVHLYYGVMDRTNAVWKTALSTVVLEKNK